MSDHKSFVERARIPEEEIRRMRSQDKAVELADAALLHRETVRDLGLLVRTRDETNVEISPASHRKLREEVARTAHSMNRRLDEYERLRDG